MVVVAVGLGSNLGDRRGHLDFAVSRLGDVLIDLRVSSYIETEPMGVAGPQAPYLNAAAVGGARLTPRDLLGELLRIEDERGRERPEPGAARTLDLDLLLFGDRAIHDADLVVPHPRFRNRRFVLAPLATIAPDMRDPVTGLTIRQLLGCLEGR